MIHQLKFVRGGNRQAHFRFVSRRTPGGCVARVDFLRKNAEDCFARAQMASSEEARTSWLNMAQHWLQLAREAETPRALARGAAARHTDLRQNRPDG